MIIFYKTFMAVNSTQFNINDRNILQNTARVVASGPAMGVPGTKERNLNLILPKWG